MKILIRMVEALRDTFDALHQFWESKGTQRSAALVLVAAFLLTLLGVELSRRGLLPPGLSHMLGGNHFLAVNLAFTLVLIMEVISLIFTLPCSVSKAVGKQIEILAVILLRSAFKHLAQFPEPVVVSEVSEPLLRLLSDGAGALAIFAILGYYHHLQQTARPAILDGASRYAFATAKKIIALVILLCFLVMGSSNLWMGLNSEPMFDFFSAFYTVLIFSDILIVLIAQRYLPHFRAVFRNSGFAVATLIIRLALTAPPYLNAALGVAAALFAVCLILIYNRFWEIRRPAWPDDSNP
ncbi:MAG TPA: hypothetical protein DD766_02475 [Desulfovibrio sp.]|nr:hypothetical protein [Desulfovibrio sp.]